jgi:UDP-sugar transporter A1/2/3
MVVQTVGIVFLIRLSRTRASNSQGYLNSTVVFCTEVGKVMISVVMLLWEVKSLHGKKLAVCMARCFDTEGLKTVFLPCGLYTLQNNLLYLALSNLSGAEYQVTFQLKILFTALFSVMILGRNLAGRQWFALAVLMAGVMAVQSRSVAETRHVQVSAAAWQRSLGYAAILGASIISGLAGVCMERALKRPGASMCVTNLQSSCIGALIALMLSLLHDGKAIRSMGFLQGYSCLVWLIIGLQAASGLLVARVLKHSGSILKCFGNAVSVVLTCLVSIWLDDLTLDAQFCCGTIFVMFAILVYSIGPDDRFERMSICSVRHRSWYTYCSTLKVPNVCG